MAMGKKKRRQQEDLWVATSELPRTAGHPFYERLNGLFNEHGFDDFVEGLCAKFYADKMGRPSLAPGVYFRLLLVGYFEGIGSERGIAWRASDSLGLREFLGLKVSESPSDHSTISRTRRLIDVATHEAVFDWVLKRIGASGLLRGKTIGIDATTLEANAALRSIVRRDSEQGYEEFLMELAKASGIETPRREDLAKLDRKRTGKGSNRVWKHPHDADARITRMKDGRTHLAHKAEHAVDLETGAIVSVTVQGADRGDTQTMVKTLTEAAEKVEQALPEGRGIEEVVADKGYHSTQRMVDLDAVGLRSYVSEPRRGKRRWRGDRQGQEAVYANRRRIRGERGQRLLDLDAVGLRSYVSEPRRGKRRWRGDRQGQEAVYANRRRIRGERGQRLLRQRGERLERPCAHLYGSGGMRRLHVRGHENVLKRLLIQVSAFNLGMLMRQSLGVGTPRGLQGRICALMLLILSLFKRLKGLFGLIPAAWPEKPNSATPSLLPSVGTT